MKKAIPSILTIGALFIKAVTTSASNYASTNDTTLINLPSPYPHGVAFCGNSLIYLTDHSNTNLYILNATNYNLVKKIKLDTAAPRGIAFTNGELWLATDSKIHKIDQESGEAIKSFSGFPKNQQGLTFFSNFLWVSSIASNCISKINYNNGNIITSFPSPARYPRGLTFDGKYLINIDSEEDTIYYIDPQNGRVLHSFLAYRGAARGITFKDNRFFIIDKDARQLISFPIVKNQFYTLAVPYVQKVSLTLKLQNSSSERLTNVVLLLALPTSSPQTEILRRVIFLNGYEIKPTLVYTDEYEEVNAKLSFDFSPYETLDIRLDCIARMWAFSVNLTTNQENTTEMPSEITALYLQDDELYQLNDPYIIAASLLAQGTAQEPFEKAKNIHNFLSERLSLDNNPITNCLNAKTIIQKGKGNSLDYSVAMVSLCRAAGIPSRIIVGLQPLNFSSGSLSSPHFWVEVYIPSYQWVPFDIFHNDTESGYILKREVAALERSLTFKKELNTARIAGWRGFYKLENSQASIKYCEMLWSDNLALNGKTIVEKGIPLCADFDGDNKADPALFQEEYGRWLVLSSKDNYIQHSFCFIPEQLSTNSAFSVFAADFDGDSKADPTFYLQTNADWIALLSGENYRRIYLTEFIGGTNEKIAVADFDGDGKADPAVFAYLSGALKVKLSSKNYTQYTFYTGIESEQGNAIPADYDGDNKADLLVADEAAEKLYAFLSSNNYIKLDISTHFIKEKFMAADCDADKKADIIFYNDASGEWSVRLASEYFELLHTFKLDFYAPIE